MAMAGKSAFFCIGWIHQSTHCKWLFFFSASDSLVFRAAIGPTKSPQVLPSWGFSRLFVLFVEGNPEKKQGDNSMGHGIRVQYSIVCYYTSNMYIYI